VFLKGVTAAGADGGRDGPGRAHWEVQDS